jgi:DNA-binding LytR/AlgR family response regulator
MEQNYFWIKDGSSFHRITIESILFVFANGYHCELFSDRPVSRINCSLLQFVKNAPEDLFMKVHRSYAVNLQHVNIITRTEIILPGHSIPLGREYARDLFARLKLKT